MSGVPMLRDPAPEATSSDWMNRHCHCVSLDAKRLQLDLDDFGAVPKNMFARYPVYASREQHEAMRRTIHAIETVTALPRFRERVLAEAPASASLHRTDATHASTRGVLFGYDFHLAKDGPKLIEVNSNAGGLLLSLAAARAHRACCEPCEPLLQPPYPLDDVERRIVAMFESEWARAGGARPLGRIAIVDSEPTAQYLHSEFQLFQAVFERAGIESVIADPSELRFEQGRLLHGDRPIDLVYNRLTDFYLEAPSHDALRRAHEARAVVLTPGPRDHALFARKSNLALLSDPVALREMEVPSDIAEVLLGHIPETRLVDDRNLDALWADRKHYYFKPNLGFGSRATYAGKKLTRRTWKAIAQGGYVAQRLVVPSERTDPDREPDASLKLDVRHYTYAGESLLVGARLYRGQTTNFRTPGGGFAPVLLHEDTPVEGGWIE